ncbi:ImmA/IrrE family metallo-endopeptidase [Aeromonas veronii]|uniref:ImmA/IrrE family metallo-endopeptidase n=1 Tax=Aeromonas veronii TaxID=654 RepID=UPI003D25D3DC
MPNSHAENVRSQFWDAQLYPVDPIAIAKRMGLQVFDAALPPGVSGAIMKRSGEPAAIYLDQSDSRQRRRFTCAHELGHYVDHLNKARVNSVDMDSYQFIDYRNGISSAGIDASERFANQFAACLLMPAGRVQANACSGWSLWQQASYFDVSAEAMHYRLMNLGIAQ